MKKRSIILLSGGLDSAANLAICVKMDFPILALTVDYGQKAAQKEIESARKFCSFYDVPQEVIGLPWLANLGQSALTDRGSAIPDIEMSQLDDLNYTNATAKAVWVPNRNGLFINVAAAFAESLSAEQIVLGFNAEEATTFPDNSSAFLKVATDTLTYSTRNHVKVTSYTDQLTKTQIVQKLRVLVPDFKFDWVWSCYRGEEKACGICEPCLRFFRARGNG